MNPAEALAHLARAILNGGPPRPEGVRACVGDQLVEPVELSYTGQDADGTHEWVALFDIHPDTVNGLRMDLLPGHTSVSCAFPTTPEDSP